MSNTALQQPQTSIPAIPREDLLSVLCCDTRWDILKLLCGSEPLGASDVAEVIGCTPSAASKHLRLLVEAGIVVQGRGRLYRLSPIYQPAPGQYTLELGHCLIRLDRPAS